MTSPDRPRRRRRIRRLLWWLAVVPVGLVVLALAGVMAVLFVSLPLPGDPEGPAVVLDVADVEFAQLTSETSSLDVSLSEVPQHTIDAVVAAEDADFYDHIGIDPRSVMRAIVTNVRNREISQGGSTITQQYIKVASGNIAQTAWRKLTEAALALKLERTHTKDEILELYLNSVYFGRGAYGIQAAAQAYYGVDVGQLTVAQSAVLAGVLPAPSIYDPAVDARASHQRYRYVLEQMADNGWLAPQERDALYSQQPPTIPRRTARRDDAPWFTDLVRRELDELGFSDSAGLTIHTTLNLGVQRHAEQAYAEHFAGQASGGPGGEQAPAGALVAVDPGSGGILALVGGRDYAQDQFNLALASRQPGSTFKAVALAAWLEAGNSPEDTFTSPGSITLPGADAGTDWTVSNYGGADLGTLSLRRATWRSSNTVYAQVTDTLGPEAVATMADRLTGQADAHPAIASLVLGTHETTPVALAGLYGTLAAGGQLATPHVVTEVWDGDRLLYQAPGPGPRVIDEGVAADVTDVLRGVVTSGTGQAAAIGHPVAGKTGTTQDYGDAWFAGYTPQVATVVWMGNRNDRSPLPGNETGGGLPAAAFATFMAAVHEGLDVMDFPGPANAPPAVAVTPTATATPTPTPTPTPTVTETETPTPASSPDGDAEPTSSPGPVPTAAPSEVVPTAPATPVPPPPSDPSPSTESTDPQGTPSPTPAVRSEAATPPPG